VDATRPYTKAAVSYKLGLKHDPDNEELKDGLCRARDGVEKDPWAGIAESLESLEGWGG